MKKDTLLPAVVVTWEDAWSYGDPVPASQAELATDAPYTSHSIGWLAYKDKKRVVIAMQALSNGDIRELLTIPMSLVRKIKKL